MKKLLALSLLISANALAVPHYTLESTGAATSSGAGAAMSPAIPGTCPDGSLMLLKTTGITASQTLTVTNWTELFSFTTGGSIKIFGRIKQSGDAAPSVDWSGSNYTEAQITCFSGDVYTDLSTIVAHSGSTNATSTAFNYPGLTITTDNTLVIIAGRHSKSSASDGITVSDEAGFTEIGERSSNGNGTQLAVWNYVQQTTATNISSGAWDVTGASQESAAWSSVVVSLKTSAAAPTFSAGPAAGTITATTIPVTYTASDAASTLYLVACIKDTTPPTGTQLKAAHCTGDVAAQASANEATTGSADSLTLTGLGSVPVVDAYGLLSSAGGDTAVQSLADQCLANPTGKQVINCPNGLTSIGAGGAVEALNAAITPDLVAGDIPIVDLVTTPEGCQVTMSVAGLISIAGPGGVGSCSSARQYVNATFYDLSAGAIHADDLDWWLNNLTPVPPDEDTVIFSWQEGVAITPIDLTQYCPDPELDTVTVTAVSGLAAGMSIVGSALSGTPTTRGITTLVLRCTDQTGASVDWQ